MAILIDEPSWEAHGRLWSHVVSDSSLEELHAFANEHGIPPRGFERDHYDVPQEYYRHLLLVGALPVTSREIVFALRSAGLRRRKQRSGTTRSATTPPSSDARKRL